MIEIETLKSSNHILEEKIKILSQKLEISKKDCIEKENLLKKMVAFNQQSENDSNLFHNLTSELQKHSTSLNMFNQNDMNMRNNRHLHELNKDTPQQNTAFENISKNDHKTEIQAQKIHENLLIEKNKENSTKLNQTNEEEKNIENNLNSLGEYKETKPETTKKCFDIYQETKKETLQHVDYHKDPKQVVEKQQDKEKPLINKPENNPEKTNMNSESPLKKKENQDLVIKNDQSPNVSKITDISPPAFKKKTEDPPMPIQKKNGAPQNSRTFTPVTFNHPKLANRNNNSSIPVVVTQKIVEQKKIISSFKK